MRSPLRCRRARCSAAAWAIAAVSAVVLAAACGPGAWTGSDATASAGLAVSSRPATSETALAPGQPSCDPRLIGPVGASFVSASDGYLLGITLSDCAASTAAKIVLRKTTDGGLHWTALPAPPAPWGGVAPDGTGSIPADGVTSVLFADARDGWVYGPGLWATHDGGATWHRVSTGGRAAQSMAAADGRVIASLESCDPVDASCDGPRSWVVETTPADRDTWRPVAGAGGAGGAVLSARPGTGYAVSPGIGQLGTGVPVLLGPADGSARWVSRVTPCRPGAIALATVTATRLLLACAQLGMHPATTYLYSSSDAGQHWQRFAVLGLFDGASTIEQAPDGTILVAGIYNGVELSRDGGRTWATPTAVDDSDAIQGGGSLQASLVTSEHGYVIGWLGPLWLTRDGGRTWTKVAIR